MAEFDATDLSRGFESGVLRMQRYGLDTPSEVFDDAVRMSTDILREWAEEVSPRFVELFAESVAIAAASRWIYKEPNLESEEILEFLRHSFKFFNSWKHQ